MSALAIGQLEAVEHPERFGDRQVDVVRDRAALDAHGAGSPASAGRRGSRGTGAASDTARAPPARSRCLLVAAPQVRQDALEAARRTASPARRAAAALRGRLRAALACPHAGAAGPKSRMSRCFLRQLAERHGRGRCRSRRRALRARRAPASGRRRAQGAIAPSASDFDSSGTIRCGSKSTRRAEPLAARAGAVRRVERERARRHLRHAEAAVDAGQPPREQPVAAVERVDDDDVVGEVERDLDRLGEPALEPRARSGDRRRTSMVWFRRRSSAMSSSSDRNWPSMRALVKPARPQRRPAPS